MIYMQESTETISIPVVYLEVFALMLISFIIGYVFAYYYQKAKYSKTIDKLRKTPMAPDTAVYRQKSVAKPVSVAPAQPAEENFDLGVHRKAFSEQVQEKPAQKNGLYIDFERLGYADSQSADDLQRIVGIGPYTEEKLNDIGIYTFEQISRFNDRDIEIVTELIKFFPDRIKNDKWVPKAKMLVQQKKSDRAALEQANMKRA